MMPAITCHRKVLVLFVLLVCACSAMPAAATEKEIELNRAQILAGSAEPSYVQYAAQGLARYLSDVTGEDVRVRRTAEAPGKTAAVIAIGENCARKFSHQYSLN
jgi:hypothetical protein